MVGASEVGVVARSPQGRPGAPAPVRAPGRPGDPAGARATGRPGARQGALAPRSLCAHAPWKLAFLSKTRTSEGPLYRGFLASLIWGGGGGKR